MEKDLEFENEERKLREKIKAGLINSDSTETLYRPLVKLYSKRNAAAAKEIVLEWKQKAVDAKDKESELSSKIYYYGLEIDTGNREKAIEGFSSLIEEVKEMGDMRTLSFIYYNLSFAIYDPEQSLKYSLLSLKYIEAAFEAKKDPKYKLMIGVSNYNLAGSYSALQDMETAQLYFTKAILIAREINNESLECDISIRAGGCALSHNLVSLGREYFKNAALINKKLNNEYLQISIENGLNGVLYEEGNYGECIENCKIILEQKSEFVIEGTELTCFWLLGKSFFKLGQYGEASVYLKKSLKSLTEDTIHGFSDTFNILAELAEKEGDYKEAFYYLKEAKELEFEVNSKNKSAAIARMRIRFETEKTEKANEILKERAEQAKKIEAQNKELARLNETKDKFFGIIAHDIRSPIISLEGIGEQMEYYLSKGKHEKVQQLTGKIDKTAKRLNNLLDNLLNWALLQQGLISVNPKMQNVSGLITKVFDLFSGVASEKSVNLINKVGNNFNVVSDELAMQTIFRNLISNAIKYSHPKSEVIAQAELKGNYCLVKIIDFGLGMNQEYIDSIFELKTKSKKGTAGERGTGLGLKLVKELVELNKGELKIESQLNIGTTVCISIPI